MMIVIVEFTLREGVEEQFESALSRMQDRVKHYDGFLGEEPCRSVVDENKFVTIFSWRDRESIKAWREDPEHVRVQELGREKLLSCYKIRVCEVEREYGRDNLLGGPVHQ